MNYLLVKPMNYEFFALSKRRRFWSNKVLKTKALTDKPFAVQYFIPIQGEPYGFSSGILQVIWEEKIKYLLVLGILGHDTFVLVYRLNMILYIIIFHSMQPPVYLLTFI